MARMSDGYAPPVRLPDARSGDTLTADYREMTLLAFLKHNCPVCQMTAPFINRFQEYTGPEFTVLAILEDPVQPARAFAEQCGLDIPFALDEDPYAVSEAFGLTTVPTLFLVEPGGRIAQTVMSWDKAKVNDIARTVARRTRRGPDMVVRVSDNVPDFRPG